MLKQRLIDFTDTFTVKILLLLLPFLFLAGCGETGEGTTTGLVTFSQPGVVVGSIDATVPYVYSVNFEYGEQKYLFFEEVGSYPHWIQIKLPGDKKAVTIYGLRAHFADPEGAERMPSEWLLQGSNDGSNWVEIDKQENQKNWKPSVEREFVIKQPTSYNFYRLYLIGGGNMDVVRVGNVFLKF